MKYKTVIDPEREEEVLIYAHRRSKLVEEIEALAERGSKEWIGYDDQRQILQFSSHEVYCFISEANKVFAITTHGRLAIKERLYLLEELLDDSFVRLNQSCIANIRMIERFDASFSGTLSVVFQNGYRDYVSRRQLKIVKERVGIKR